MSSQTNNGSADPQLRRNSLGLSELVFQGVTHIAPATNVVFTFPIIALKAGPVMPLSFLLATIVCFFIGNTVSQFSRYIPSSGGYYSFATRGLGSHFGFMATWSYLIYEILGTAGCTGFLGYLVSDMVQMQFHVNIPWWTIALATCALVWALTHQGVQISARVTALLGRFGSADYAGAGDYFPRAPGKRFHLRRAAAAFRVTASLWWNSGGNGFQHIGIKWIRGAGADGAGSTAPGKVCGTGNHAFTVCYRSILCFHVICQFDWMGNRRYGSVCRES